MILRFLGISFLKWLAIFFSIAYLYGFVPSGAGTILPTILAWVVVFVLSAIFVMLAFGSSVPSKRPTYTLIVVWFAVTVVCYGAYSIGISSMGLRAFFSVQIIGQMAVEAVAILITTYLLRRRSFKRELGESAT